MKTGTACLPCFIRLASEGMRRAGVDRAGREHVMQRVHNLLACLDMDAPPPLMGRTIHHLIAEAARNPDPYREIKERSNRFALKLLPGLAALVAGSADPFATAVRLAIAGNIIDFGAGLAVGAAMVEQAVAQALSHELDSRALELLRSAVRSSRRILYVGDNAGEAVFDRLLLELLPAGKTLYAVRGGPVINDCTRRDAEAAGIEGLAPVIDTGSDIPGIVLERCSESFRRSYGAADLIIAKGQGNYETLGDAAENIFFLFKVKCETVAASCGRSRENTALLCPASLTARVK